jgi:putative DNA primase/helicase
VSEISGPQRYFVVVRDDGSVVMDEATGRPKQGPFQPTLLAEDVMADGPLSLGTDDRTWAWSRGAWQPDDTVIRDRCVRRLADLYRREHAGPVEDTITAVLRHRGALVSIDRPDPRFVNVANGLWDWAAGVLRPHDPDVMSTCQSPVPYEPGAACPQFGAWLVQALPADVIPLMWEVIAYALYAGNPFHQAVLLKGSGRNGKGVFLRVLKGLLGDRNVAAATLDDLSENRFAVAELAGKCANIAGDVDPTYQVRTGRFKALTGGDVMYAERKGKDPFSFTPFALPIFSANKIPQSADVSPGYLARWLVIPFPVSFAGREDRTLDGRLAGELPGILATALRYLPALMERGRFCYSDSAEDAKRDFARRQDGVRWWLGEYCEERPGARSLRRSAAYTAYRAAMESDGYRPVAKGEFFDRLENAGVTATKSGGEWVLCDWALRALAAPTFVTGYGMPGMPERPPLAG